jgi:hypothetical protein
MRLDIIRKVKKWQGCRQSKTQRPERSRCCGRRRWRNGSKFPPGLSTIICGNRGSRFIKAQSLCGLRSARCRRRCSERLIRRISNDGFRPRGEPREQAWSLPHCRALLCSSHSLALHHLSDAGRMVEISAGAAPEAVWTKARPKVLLAVKPNEDVRSTVHEHASRHLARYCPSWRGFMAVGLVLFACIFLPALTPARRSHHQGFLGTSVSFWVWFLAAITFGLTLPAIVLCFRSSSADRVVELLTGVVTLWMIYAFVRAVT